MRSIIEELYYGNVTPCDRDIIRGGTYSHILNLVTRNEDELMQTLTQAKQETFKIQGLRVGVGRQKQNDVIRARLQTGYAVSGRSND